MGRLIGPIISLGLVAAALAGATWWLWQYQPQQVLAIEAAQDRPDLALPVYAQFVVTQTLTLTQPVELTGLTVPMWSPAAGQQLTLTLRQDKQVYGHWQPVTRETGEVEELHLPLASPQLLQGELALVIAAEHLTHQEQAVAPRLFIEAAGEHYPGGNYFIAQNSKTGDVALTLTGRARRYRDVLARWQAAPLTAGFDLSLALLALLALGALPHRLLEWWRHLLRRESADA